MKKQSKSAKVRLRLKQGQTPAEITKAMRLPRNFVYQVQFAMRKKEKAGFAREARMVAGELPLEHPMFAKKPTRVLPGSKAKGANAVQVGGQHYKTKGTQPWDVIIEWNMGFLDGNALKYLVRFRDKGGVEDLQKARHYIDKLIEVEGGKK